MTIEKELLEVQKKLKAPKDQKNNFGNYNYRKAEDILEAVKECTTRPVTLQDEIQVIGDRYYLKATASFGIGVDAVKASALARETLTKKGCDDAQVTGAASSYARKYALQGLFAIDDSREDPDSKNNHEESKPVAKPIPTGDKKTPVKDVSGLLKSTKGQLEKCKDKKTLTTLKAQLIGLKGRMTEEQYQEFKVILAEKEKEIKENGKK